MCMLRDKIWSQKYWFSPPHKQLFSAGYALIIVVIFFLLSYGTYTRNKYWQKNEIEIWEGVAAKSPAKFRPHYNLGVLYDKQGRLTDAVTELLTAIRLEPDNAKAHNNLGYIYGKQNHLEEAVKELKVAIRLDPNHYLAYKNLQTAYEHLGEFDEAERARKDADAVSHYEKGRLLAKQGHLEEAIRELQTSIMLKPDYEIANRELSVLSSKRTMEGPVK